MRKIIGALMCSLFVTAGFSQSGSTQPELKRSCSSMDNLKHRMSLDPSLKQKMESIEHHTQEQILKKQGFQRRVDGEIITIPVVVHVIYNNNNENISDAQILSQIEVLNDDFRRTNSDADNTWSQASDTQIEFALATVDPNGNPTTGITRKSSSVSEWGTDDAMKRSSQGGVNPWDATEYLNMWVCNIGSGLLGYAQFPGGSTSTDGVVMGPNYFGSSDYGSNFYLSAPFDKGRTTTHEIGHYLNLRHIWGDGNCNVDDFVSDTPGSDNPNYGCATGHTSCGSEDMVQNYMDYSDDACMNLFTVGQKDRMRTVLEAGGSRRSLALSDKFDGVVSGPTCSDGIQNGDETGIDCGGSSCVPCATSGCTENELAISITFDNYPEETSWAIVNSAGQTVASESYSTSNADGSSVVESLCLPDGCYTFTINDVYGDGMCCDFGNGSYSVSGASGVLVSGGSFASSESNEICLGGGSNVDSDAPTAPSNVTASNIEEEAATVSWSASSDNVAVTGYNVYQGSTLLGQTTGTSATVSGLSEDTSYTFSITAFDAAGNESSASSITFSTAGGSTAGCETLNFNDFSLNSFSTQDSAGNASVGSNGGSLTLTNNTWKYIDYDYTVTANTVVEFTFSSTSEGEIHGIGFDDDNDLSATRYFKVFGTQNYGVTNYDNYSNGTVTYVIPVGDSFTGNMDRLLFINDNDGGSGNTSTFSNVKVYESSCSSSRSVVQFGARVDVLGTEDEGLLSSLTLAPNPVKKGSALSVSLSNNNLDVNYSVINMLGQILDKGILTNGSVGTTNLKAGVYILNVKTKEGEMNSRFVVE